MRVTKGHPRSVDYSSCGALAAQNQDLFLAPLDVT